VAELTLLRGMQAAGAEAGAARRCQRFNPPDSWRASQSRRSENVLPTSLALWAPSCVLDRGRTVVGLALR
jgi:hypothetical protein